MNRKYHSGLMPAGAEAKGSAFTPRFHGKQRGQCAKHADSHVPGHQFAQQEVGKELHLPAQRGIGGPLGFNFGRNAHALALDQKKVDGDKHRRPCRGRTATWNPKKRVSVAPVTCWAAAKKDHQGLADDRDLSGHLRADRGGEEGQLVPGQQIAAESESHDQKEQHHAA